MIKKLKMKFQSFFRKQISHRVIEFDRMWFRITVVKVREFLSKEKEKRVQQVFCTRESGDNWMTWVFR